MQVTVLATTYRTQFLKTMYYTLKHQSFKDFEWLLVDANYEQNKDGMSNLVKGMNFVHLPQKKKLASFAKASALNDGLVMAKGELIYFMNDYEILDKNCILQHIKTQDKLGGVMLSGMIRDLQCQSDGRAEAFTLGIYKASWHEINLCEGYRDGVNFHYNGRNDSCPLKPLIECNGYDEQCDGGWGGEDSDMANRLMTYGLRFFLDRWAEAWELPHISGERPSIKDNFYMEKVIKQRIKDKVTTCEQGLNLARKRYEGNKLSS